MKIICICYENLGLSGGSAIQVIEIAKNLKKLGHKICLTAPLIRRYQNNTDIEIKYIPTLNFPQFRYLSYLILSFIYLPIYFLRFKPDAILIFEIYLDLLSPMLSKIFHRPFAFYINAIASEELHFKSLLRIIIFIINFIQKISVKLASKIFVVTNILKDDVQIRHRISEDKIKVIKNGVDIEVFKPRDKQQMRKQLGFDEKLSLVGYVGRFFPWHGVDYLIEAAPSILKEIPYTKFVIVGEGGMKRSLVNQVEKFGLKDRFLFTESIPYSQVPLYINAFDICVVFFKTVRRDPGDPIKLYEYLACGRPVVASNVKGYGDFVEEIEAGVSVDARNPKEVSRTIITLIKNEALREQMEENGRAAIVKTCSWRQRAKEIEGYLMAPYQ